MSCFFIFSSLSGGSVSVDGFNRIINADKSEPPDKKMREQITRVTLTSSHQEGAVFALPICCALPELTKLDFGFQEQFPLNFDSLGTSFTPALLKNIALKLTSCNISYND